MIALLGGSDGDQVGGGDAEPDRRDARTAHESASREVRARGEPVRGAGGRGDQAEQEQRADRLRRLGRVDAEQDEEDGAEQRPPARRGRPATCGSIVAKSSGRAITSTTADSATPIAAATPRLAAREAEDRAEERARGDRCRCRRWRRG